ncbi:MAG TPA: Hpt domain-containing protein, partial [Cytophagaceae bacterium]
EKLKDCLKQRNWEQLRETAHRLKPGFGHIANKEIADLLEEIENYLLMERTINEKVLAGMIDTVTTKGYEQIRQLKIEKAKLMEADSGS